MFTPKFSIGYNNEYDDFVELIKKYSEDIESVYFPPPKKILGSGRITDQSIKYDKEIINLIKICKSLGITPYLILNSTIVSPYKVEEAIKYVKKLYNESGLKNLTITDPYLIIRIKKEIPEMFIEASTLCRIHTIQELRYFKEIGVQRFTTDRETIRNIPLLKRLSEILPLRILVNEGCIKNCIYKYAHYNMLSANVDDTPIIPFGKKFERIKKNADEMDSLCVNSVSLHPYKIFSSPFIRPEDLVRYKDISSIFKISTRNSETKRIEFILKSYIAQKYEGNLVTLLNTSYIERIFEYIDNSKLNDVNFFEKLSSCDDDCEKCDFCKKLMKIANVKLKDCKN